MRFIKFITGKATLLRSPDLLLAATVQADSLCHFRILLPVSSSRSSPPGSRRKTIPSPSTNYFVDTTNAFVHVFSRN